MTFTANYLTTTLPNQMSVNDLNHEVQVEDQVGELQALLDSVADSGRVGAPVSQPISLGSAGSPPFAGPDSGGISPGNLSGGFQVNFTVAGPSTYAPPTGAPLTGHVSGSGICPTPSSTGFSDVGACYDTWNFTGDSKSFSFSNTGSGSDAIIVTTNSSTITVTGTGSAGDYFEFIGNHNSISMSGVGSGMTNISVIGSYDTLSIGTVGSSPVTVWIYGNQDSVTVTSTGSGPVKVTVYGTQDTFSVPSDVGSQVFNLYLNGFNATAPTSPLCPYGNLSSTDKVTKFSEVGSGGLTQYDNNAVGYYANGTGPGSCLGNATCWATHSRNVPLTTCPFFTQVTLPIPTGGSKPGASLVVHLSNTYAPSAEVAYDQGAVVYAQSGGVPIMIDGPSFSYSHSSLSLMIPVFTGPVPSESGLGTADVMLRLLSTNTYLLPENGYSLKTGSHVTLSLQTPYWAAWMTYFGSISGLSGLVSCKNSAGVTCPAPTTVSYQPGQRLATITLSLPATSLDLTVATFSVQFT